MNKNGSKADERLGEERYNHQGCLMKIIEYNGANNIIVQFDNNPNNTVKAEYQRFKKGKINNPLFPTVYGVGITGNEVPRMNGNEKLKEYRVWVRIMERCYSTNVQPRSITYEDCEASEEFKYYPNFYNWIINQENYEIWKSTENYAVDKDIIHKGNKIYSADNCCLVPNSINNLIKNTTSRRGEFLVGVTKDPHRPNLFWSQCWNGLLNKNVYLGSYQNEYDAFLAYKTFKEKLIKETADKAYENKQISKKCWEALQEYEVEVTD